MSLRSKLAGFATAAAALTVAAPAMAQQAPYYSPENVTCVGPILSPKNVDIYQPGFMLLHQSNGSCVNMGPADIPPPPPETIIETPPVVITGPLGYVPPRDYWPRIFPYGVPHRDERGWDGDRRGWDGDRRGWDGDRRGQDGDRHGWGGPERHDRDRRPPCHSWHACF